MTAARVIHAKNAHQFEPDEFVWITRDTKWGNPFVLGTHGTRAEVIEMYGRWILNQNHLIMSLWELQGKVLVCYCKPQACHGDVLLKLLASFGLMDECGSCGETPENECPKSKRPCGHHCNHVWEQDECCWCGQLFGEV